MNADAAARWLAEAWESGNPLGPLPEDLAPRSIAEGEEIAAALVEALGQSVIGLRVAPGPGGAPLAGPVLEGRLLRDGATIAAAVLRHARVTAAAVGILAEPLDEMGTGAPVFVAVHPALDIADTRFAIGPESDALVVADLAGLGHVVAGPRAPVPDSPVPVALAEGRRRPAGDAVDIMAALHHAAREARRLGGLPAGAVLVAAGLSPALIPQAGVAYVARLGPLGRARVTIG
ncbi:MAG TPA: hypothetical protein VD970_11190 [Acetobacteraceae bacterium]|nr:hypothetical protein [Acetobacteraceae bacterium]